MAATAITPLQLAGVKPLTLELLFPAAATTTVPALLMAVMAFCQAVEHEQFPPRLISDHLGRVGIGRHAADGQSGRPGDPVDDPESRPPHFPRTRTINSLETQLIPAMPMALLVAAAGIYGGVGAMPGTV